MGYLTAKAVTVEAITLRDAVAKLVLSGEGRERRRSEESYAGLMRAAEAFLGDLLIHHPALTFIPTANERFTGMEVSARHFTALAEGMMRAGLLFRRDSFRTAGAEWSEGGPSVFGSGWAKRFWPSPELIGMAERLGTLADPVRHFERPPPPLSRGRAVVLRDLGLKGSRAKGRLMRLPQGDRLERLRREVMGVNAALASADIGGCEMPVLRRVFTVSLGSDTEPPLHGRWYGITANSYVFMPKEQRRGITIAGEPVAEVDVSASQFWCLYGVARRLGVISATPAPGTDLYAVPGLPRAVVKRFVTATCGNGGLPGRWPNGTTEEFTKEAIRKRDYPIRAVSHAITAAHPILTHLDAVLRAAGLQRFDQSEPQRLFPHWLMGIEAEAVTIAMLRMLREDAVKAMPLHDCLLVPARMADTAVYRLQQAYRAVAGVEPAVKVKGRGE